MQNIYIKVYSPYNVGIVDNDDVTLENIKKYCVRVYKYKTAGEALLAYANTMCDWSKLLDENANIEEYVDKVAQALLTQDIDWLEENCI